MRGAPAAPARGAPPAARWLLAIVADLAAAAAFWPRAAASMLRGPPLVDTVLLSLRLVVTSVPVVFVVTFFGGAMLTVQAAASLSSFGGGALAGIAVGFGGIREVFPLLAAASVAARSGAEIASQLATMRVTRQIDALEVMGIDPVRLLVGPRMIAAVIGTPLCVLVGCGAGMVGAQAIGVWQLGVDRGAMWTNLWGGIVAADLVVGAVKGLVLGFMLGAISAREGLCAEPGARGVGRATNRAVIRALVVVSGASLALSTAIYGRLAG